MGSGGAPMVARIARELGALTVAVVTKPFAFEGKRRTVVANDGIARLHATADTEIRIRQAREIAAAAGSDDVTYVEMKDAPHYLEGHRPEAMDLVAEWIRRRFP